MTALRFHPEHDTTAPLDRDGAAAGTLREYGAAAASFAVLIAGSLIFLWISRGTQFHQLAIGVAMSSTTLLLVLALFEVCWKVGLRMVGPIRSDGKD